MKIIQAMAGAPHGGAENFFTRLAPALGRIGIDQKVIIRRNAERASELRAGGIEPVELKFGGRLDIKTRWDLGREIKNYQPDIVMTWMNRATMMCRKKHPDDFIHVARLGGYYDLKYYRHCDHLIGNTQHLVEYMIEEGWPAEKAHYVPNFVTRTEAAPIDKKHLSTPETVPLIVAFGRLHENKAFDVLIEALGLVPDAYLWIAGEGPLREELEELAKENGVRPRIRFLGWRNDTAALLNTADLFVCPSRHEPLGNVVIEAWAQGTPLVAADAHGPVQLIENGVSGLLVPVNDVKIMGAAIKEALADQALLNTLSEGGTEAFETQFTEKIVIRQYQEFFEKVLR